MPRRRHFLTIGQKLAIAIVTLGVVLATISSVVVHHVGKMRDDARQVDEETHEATIAGRIANELRSARALAETEPLARYAERIAQRGADRLTAAEGMLERFAAISVDSGSSPAEHEGDEQRLCAAIRRQIAAARAAPASAGEAIAEAERLADALAETTLSQAASRHQDLELRAQRATSVIWGTVTACALALVAILLCVSRCITKPLAQLRAGADRIGEGDLGHRFAIPSRDEIGDLARAFDRMAERLARNHAELEERVRARTSQFLRAAKLADLGTLAAGFAHEINNPLASIASSAEGLERRLARGAITPEQEAEYLRTIASEAYRARSITSRLMDLARQEQAPQGLVDLRDLVLGHSRLVESELEHRGITLVLDLPEQVPPVRGNAAELTQALMNLVLNARDASPRGGSIRISITLDEELVLKVEDQGPGILVSDLERIFEPFFTTKPPGMGTGLGLALAHAIAESHHGSLQAENRPEGGAMFTLSLPFVRSEAA